MFIISTAINASQYLAAYLLDKARKQEACGFLLETKPVTLSVLPPLPYKISGAIRVVELVNRERGKFYADSNLEGNASREHWWYDEKRARLKFTVYDCTWVAPIDAAPDEYAVWRKAMNNLRNRENINGSLLRFRGMPEFYIQ